MDSVEKYDIAKNQWSCDVPILNIPRFCHSSCTLFDSVVFVFCGYNNSDNFLNSIERLDYRNDSAAEEWDLVIVSNQISGRVNPFVCPIG